MHFKTKTVSLGTCVMENLDAVAESLTFCSPDGDFARLKDLRWTNPIAK
jgi:hypothetical protein